MNKYYQEKFSPIEEMIILSVKENRLDSERKIINNIYKIYGDEAIYKSAKENKVVSMVAHGLMDSVSKEELSKRWIIEHNKMEEKVSYIFNELDKIAIQCESKSIRIVLIENGGILRDIQKCRGCFASSDIEILIKYENIIDIENILFKEGYERRSRERCSSEKVNQNNSNLYGWNIYYKKIVDLYDFWINIQWRPVIRRWIPLEQGLDSEALINRSINIKEKSSPIIILSPEDNLLLCALHVASHSYVRGIGLRLQLDVHRIVCNIDIDWDKFIKLAKLHCAEQIVFPSLAIPKSLFNTPIPEYVLSKLVPSIRRQKKILQIISNAGIFNKNTFKYSAWKMAYLEILLAKGSFFHGLRRIILPPAVWIREEENYLKSHSIIWCYIIRIFKLARRKHA